MDETGRIEILNDEGKWVEIPIGKLEIGMTFRMFEPDGTRVKGKLGSCAWMVTGEPNGLNYEITCSPIMWRTDDTDMKEKNDG